MTSKPRKSQPKKAVAPAADDPQTPYYDARAEDGSFAKEADDATAPEAVAEAPASAGDSAPEGAAGGVEPGVVLLTDEERRHIEEHVIPASVAAMASAQDDTPEPLAGIHCSECLETDDLVMVGNGDAARSYCKKHRPLNA